MLLKSEKNRNHKFILAKETKIYLKFLQRNQKIVLAILCLKYFQETCRSSTSLSQLSLYIVFETSASPFDDEIFHKTNSYFSLLYFYKI